MILDNDRPSTREIESIDSELLIGKFMSKPNMLSSEEVTYEAT